MSVEALDYLTVTLTGRAPVRICRKDWPKIAFQRDWDGEHECQAFHKWWISVREHADGRVLVYGCVENAGVPDMRRGELVTGNVPSAIHRVATSLGLSEEFKERVIADLPAEEI